jgi:hypothetical protein
MPATRVAEAPRTSWRLGIDALGSYGTAPSVAAGVAVFGELRWRALSLALEGRLEAPGSTKGGEASSWLYAGQLVPCFHLGPVFACALGSIGQFVVSSAAGAGPSSGSALFAAAGARLGAELPVSRRFLLRAHADGLVDLAPPTYLLDGHPVWSAPRLGASLALGIAVQFP